MTQSPNILNELNELNSSLAGKAVQHAYTVPAGYFEGLPGILLNRIKAMEAENAKDELGFLSPVLNDITRQMPYSVPDDYFSGLAERALADTNQTPEEELETISPFLSALKKENPYSVPAGYFERLHIPVEEAKPAVKVVAITSRSWFRYAAAAIVIGIMVIGGLSILRKNTDPANKPFADLKSDIKKMDDQQKEKLADLMDAELPVQDFAKVNPDLRATEVKALLEGVSDEELKNFQEQTEDIEEVLMTN